MPLRFVINGYFRSGTTMLYQAVSAALDAEHASFYEPCYPLLGLVVRNELESRQVNPLHGQKVWDSYVRLDPQVFEELVRNHPNTSKLGIAGDEAFRHYMDIFHRMRTKVFLQTNRFHFFLDPLLEDYNSSVVHIIRHPLDVYRSISNAYYRNTTPGKALIRRSFRPLLVRNFFGVEREYDWIVRHTGYPLAQFDNWKMRYLKRYDYFTRFIAVWIVSNYFALRSIERHGGLLLCYEKIVAGPEKEFEKLSEHLGLQIAPPEIRAKEDRPWSGSEYKRLIRTVRALKLETQWDYINVQLSLQEVTYASPEQVA